LQQHVARGDRAAKMGVIRRHLTTFGGWLNFSSQWQFQEKIFEGPGPSSLERQQRLSEITIEPI